MENKLKPITTSIIETLQGSDVRTVMATGDNILTAIAVGKECAIIDKEATVFLGDVKSQDGVERVVWKCTSKSETRLNEETLEPEFLDDRRGGRKSEHQRKKDTLRKSMTDNEDVIYEKDLPWQHMEANYTLALTGKAFNLLASDPRQKGTLQRVLLNGQIYARMSPEDKAILVEQLQGFCKTEVGMCGDGANDCGALK
mmetsp:Transcript_38181/g.36539  ORF Transcript_38181/g.36539 Transcript_38181/m.36539 type:complete len:199 (+) Transcript_38181:1276-1872(+)